LTGCKKKKPVWDAWRLESREALALLGPFGAGNWKLKVESSRR
jgi:hypothetical protein